MALKVTSSSSDYLDNQNYIKVSKMNILVFDDRGQMRPEDRRSVYQRESPQKYIHSVSHSEFISSKEGMQRYRFEYTVHGIVY